MSANRIQNLSPANLEVLATRLLAVTTPTGGAAKYGVDQSQVDSLQGSATSLAAASEAVSAAKAAYHAAVQHRDVVAEGTAYAAASMARSIYAYPGITPGLIAAAGLSPRSTSKARVVPTTPVGLVALPQTNGAALLSWIGVGTGMTYVVEAQFGSGAWEFVTNSKRSRLRLEGYAASGQAVAFRVSASANEQVSLPSVPATIYASSTTPALKLAA